MTLLELLRFGRQTWGPRKLTLTEVAVAAQVVAGDLARQARTAQEGGRPDMDAVAKQLGNLIVSGVRWADDLGLDPERCVHLAKVAQMEYRKERTR